MPTQTLERTDITTRRKGARAGNWSMYLLLNLAWKNVKLRYKSSFLGFFWSLLNPLLFLLIFSFIFSKAFPDIDNYPVFALTGLIFWSFFATSSGHVLGSLVESATVLKSLSVKPILFPLSQIIAGCINLLMSFIPFVFILIYLGWEAQLENLLVFPVATLLAVFTFGIALALSALNVFFRDTGMLWGALLPAFFYFTPIAYPVELIPADMKWVIELNPLYHFVEAFRTVLYHAQVLPLNRWLLLVALATFSLLIGLLVFKRLERGFISNY
jgi:ABC-2 type transport system permease protein